MSKEAVYAHGHQGSILRLHSWRTAENSAAYLIPYLKPNMTLLDIGCGPGSITADFAALLSEGHATGLEVPNSDVVDKARAYAAGRGITNITFTTGSALALPFPDATFDVVHAHQVLQHVGDPILMLKEMRRVAKPGGYVAAREADFGGMVWYPESEGLEDWRQGYMKIARANGGEPIAGRRLHVWAKAAGFMRESMTLSAGTWCYSSPAEREFWGGVWADHLITSGYAASAMEHGVYTEEGLKRVSEAWRQWVADEDGWFTVLHGELVARVE